MTSYLPGEEPESVTNDIGSLGMTKRDRAVPAQLACRIGARPRAGERDAWPAVVAIALGSFALVFSEVIPVGLLGDISGTWACRSGPAG